MNDPQPLRYAVLEITNACNLRCNHCASSSGTARKDELSLEEIRLLLKDIRELGCEEITILGGEPFLHSNWYEICRLVTEYDMKLILISNGILIRDREIKLLCKLRPYLIGISIDGASSETYRKQRGVDAFDRLISLLHLFLEEGHENVNAITTFTRSNLNEFDAFADLFDSTNITWQVQIANKGGNRFDMNQFITRDQYAWLVRKMKGVFLNRQTLHLRHMDDFGYFPIDPALHFLHETWKGCIAGRELIGVRSNGDLLGCLSLGDEFVESNIRDMKLKDLWTSGTCFKHLRDKVRLLSGTCKICPYGENCMAGCTGMAWSATGTIGCNPYCIRSLETKEILQDFV